MCRVLLRTPRACLPPEPACPPSAFAALLPSPLVKDELLDDTDFAAIFEGIDEAAVDVAMASDLELMELFNSAQSTAPQATVVALPAAPAAPAVGAPAPLAAPRVLAPGFEDEQIEALQMQALMRAAAYPTPAPAPFSADAFQALLMQQGRIPAAPVTAAGHKRSKMQDAAEQEARIKKRRRESAARSRQRKNTFVHALEAENAALRAELEQLRALAGRAAVGASADSGAPASGASCLHLDRAAKAQLAHTQSSTGVHSSTGLGAGGDFSDLLEQFVAGL